MIRNQNITIPLIIGLILIISSFLPILQILIFYLNGGLIHVVQLVFSDRSELEIEKYFYATNLILSTISLIIFYYTTKTFSMILSAIISALFMFPLFATLIEKIITEDTIYFLQLMLAGLGAGLLLLIVGILKAKYQNKEI